MRVADLSAGQLRARFRTGLPLRVGSFAVRVCSDLPDVISHLAFLYADYPLCDDAISDAEIDVTRAGILGTRRSIYVDGHVMYHAVSRQQVVPLFEWAFNLCVFHRPSLYLLLHAAVVEKDGIAVILPGEAGAGKSTLCAALTHRGWRLLSDEVAMVKPNDGRLWPAPRPISLKEESIESFRQFAPTAMLGPVWPDTAKGRLAHVRPPSGSVHRMAEPAEPGWVIFPSFEAGVEAAWVDVPKEDTVMHCAMNAFNYSPLRQDGFLTLADLVQRCDCYEFRYSDLEEAVAEMDALCASRRVGV